MPLPREYDPYAFEAYHTEYSRRLERDEARRVACEQYTRANKLEQEKQELQGEYDMTNENLQEHLQAAEDLLAQHWDRAMKAERERDDYIKQLDNMCDECGAIPAHQFRDMYQAWWDAELEKLELGKRRAHWREAYERVSGERDELKTAVDESSKFNNFHKEAADEWRRVAEKLEREKVELAKALKTTRKSPWELDEIEQLKAQNAELVKVIEPAIEWLTKWEAGDWTHQYKYCAEVLEGLKAAFAKLNHV